MKILVVDDDELVNRTISRALEAHGFEVYSAKDAADALSLVANCGFDLVLCDIRMPGKINGIEMAKIIEEKKKIKCVMMSGYPEYFEILERENMKYLDKPIDMSDMLKAIHCGAA